MHFKSKLHSADYQIPSNKKKKSYVIFLVTTSPEFIRKSLTVQITRELRSRYYTQPANLKHPTTDPAITFADLGMVLESQVGSSHAAIYSD